ncbi:hypothetical protein Cgig2_021857 [Carnegiea gigantea]|uniref:Uncharacterized protein n=1 Tax=Carnegiea gigantea TaxID=171969 RepID=A0A9Q1QCB5_9CARY|nr:hypothetical protein Cgig2_021857 [Carnegiea gigantea]
MTIFADLHNHYHFHYLVNLVDLDRDPPQPIFYMRALALEDMTEIKEGIYFINYVDHQGDYGAYQGRLMTHLVTAAEAPIPSLNIEVSTDFLPPLLGSRASQFRKCSFARAKMLLSLPMLKVGALIRNHRWSYALVDSRYASGCAFGGSSSGFPDNH